MLKSNLLKSLALFLLMALAISSCKKEEDPDKDTDSTLDFALADASFGDAGKMADQSEGGSPLVYYKTGSILAQCATVTIDIPVKRITIDFGTANCLCADQRNRRGIVYVDYTGPFHTPGNSYVVSFNNYFVDDNKIMGTRTVSNTGLNAANNPTFSVVDANGQIVKANNGGTILWTSSRTNEWIAGDSTATWVDDVWLVSGTSAGTSSAGENFTATINSANPLQVQVGCRWITAGEFDFTPGTQATRTVNYGTGLCDALATVTVAGYVINIVLP